MIMYITRVKANRKVKTKRIKENKLISYANHLCILYFVFYNFHRAIFDTLFPRLTHFERMKTLPNKYSNSYALMYSHTLQISSTVILPFKHQNQTVQHLQPTLRSNTPRLNILIKHSTLQKKSMQVKQYILNSNTREPGSRTILEKNASSNSLLISNQLFN